MTVRGWVPEQQLIIKPSGTLDWMVHMTAQGREGVLRQQGLGVSSVTRRGSWESGSRSVLAEVPPTAPSKTAGEPVPAGGKLFAHGGVWMPEGLGLPGTAHEDPQR